MQNVQGPESEVLEPEVSEPEVFVFGGRPGEVDLVKPQETQTEPASVCPQIQIQFWNQPGGEKTLKNGLGPNRDLCTAELEEV